MGREVRAKIEQLREKMAERGMDAYLIPTSDFHGSEYVSGYFKCRKYMTGFTGSAGTAVITMEDAGLWTDGRYFVQAEKQLSGTEYKLMRMGSAGVPALNEYCRELLKEGMTIGFDGRCVQAGLESVTTPQADVILLILSIRISSPSVLCFANSSIITAS